MLREKDQVNQVAGQSKCNQLPDLYEMTANPSEEVSNHCLT